jgi:hypothetical protein
MFILALLFLGFYLLGFMLNKQSRGELWNGFIVRGSRASWIASPYERIQGPS